MNFRFVTQRVDTKRHGRGRSRNACDTCRYKKKRCDHNRPFAVEKNRRPQRSFTTDTLTPNSCVESDALSPTTSTRMGNVEELWQHQDQCSEHQQQGSPSHQSCTVCLAHARPPTLRFVGDLNPEARLLDEAISSEGPEETASGEMGVWIHPRSMQHDTVDAASNSSYKQSHYQSGCRATPTSDLVSDATIKTLSDLYFNDINPIIPLLDEEGYRETLSQASIPTPLVHAICLVAAKGNEARRHLKLVQSGDRLLSVRHFCTKLHSSIMKELAWRAPIPKMTLIRILGLLSLHHEGSDGAEQASSCLSQAVHYAQTLGLQLQQPRRRDNSSAMKRLFWCLWTLDRLNAAIHSRPCCMADVDIAVDYLTPEESGSKAFDVWFKIAKLLNQVIGLYRPRSDGPVPELDTGFPGFEGIMDEMQAWQLSNSTVATLHIFYLATAILAHRLKTITALPSPTQARLRQQLSAIQILKNMQGPERLNALHPLPIVVYAPSLALSIFYQHLRYSRLLSDQEDARRDFDAACGILQELRKSWEAADPMASLAQRISVALATLPSLEVLCLHRPEATAREEGENNAQRSQVEEEDDESSTTDTAFNHSSDSLRFLPEQQTLDLFDGMNDVSWMYLDVDNPVSFESFPMIDYQSL